MISAASANPSAYWGWLQLVQPPLPDPLGWCHTTDAYALRDILSGKAFRPKLCPVFNEELSYFFYGRPAYRFKENGTTIRVDAKAPVVFVFSSKIVALGRRIYPFDSGAFAGTRYSEWMHPSMTLADFEMQCDIDAPQKHVAAFFSSNEDYLQCRVKPEASTPPGVFEAESVLKMLKDGSANNADDRRAAVELQINLPMILDPTCVTAIVLPNELIDARYVKEFVSTSGGTIELIPYKQQYLKCAKEYQALLEERVIELQCKGR